jgi:hypothetical protein
MANNDNSETVLEELSLILMYLTRFRENKEDGWRAWKGYEFTVLDNLRDNECISFSSKAKSLYLEEKGIEKAKQLMKKYGIEIEE